MLAFIFIFVSGIVFSNENQLSKEIELVVDHLTTYRSKEVKSDLIHEINSDLNLNNKWQNHILCKNAFYRVVLHQNYNQHSSKKVNISLLNKMLNKMTKEEAHYSKLALFIMKSLYSDYGPYLKNNFIDKIITGKVKSKKSINIYKLNRYFYKWIQLFLTKSPIDFNAYLSKTSVKILRFLKDELKTLRLQNKKNKSLRKTKSISLSLLPLKMTSKKNKQIIQELDGKSLIPKIEINDLSSASKEVDSLLKEKPKKWSPK